MRSLTADDPEALRARFAEPLSPSVPVDPLDLAAALADALEAPLPSIGLPAHLWLLGTGSHHDAAELVTHLFAGTGRSCRAIGTDGHAQLPGLIGPADTVVLVGPTDDEFLEFGQRVAAGAGALVVELPEMADGGRQHHPAPDRGHAPGPHRPRRGRGRRQRGRPRADPRGRWPPWPSTPSCPTSSRRSGPCW